MLGSSIAADLFAVGDGEETADDFGRSVVVDGGGVAVGEEGEGDVWMRAGYAGTVWRLGGALNLV